MFAMRGAHPRFFPATRCRSQWSASAQAAGDDTGQSNRFANGSDRADTAGEQLHCGIAIGGFTGKCASCRLLWCAREVSQ